MVKLGTVPRSRKTHRKVSALGSSLRRIRERAGLDQEDLADRAHIHRLTVTRIETGAISWVRPDTLEKLAGALGVKPSELMEGEPQVADTQKLVAAYLASPWAKVDAPTDDEMAWLNGLPGLIWLGMKPNEKTLHLMIEALRSGRS